MAVTKHSIQDHDPLDHLADRAEASVPVVVLANRFVERLVVDVVQPSASRRSRLDGRANPRVDKAGDKLAAVLAARSAREGAY